MNGRRIAYISIATLVGALASANANPAKDPSPCEAAGAKATKECFKNKESAACKNATDKMHEKCGTGGGGSKGGGSGTGGNHGKN